MAIMPSAEVLREDIELRSTWSLLAHTIKVEGLNWEMVELERRVMGGPYRNRRVRYPVAPTFYFKSGLDYEVALARLLADAEASYAKLLESGDGRNTQAAA